MSQTVTEAKGNRISLYLTNSATHKLTQQEMAVDKSELPLTELCVLESSWALTDTLALWFDHSLLCNVFVLLSLPEQKKEVAENRINELLPR